MSNNEIKNLIQNQFDKLQEIKLSDISISDEEDYIQKERLLRIHIETCKIIEKHLGENEAKICKNKLNKLSFTDKLLHFKAYLKVLIESL